MNQIRALSAGAKAETERFSGAVHSVFARACNIALDDGQLLSLFAPEMGNAPAAVRLDLPREFAFDRALAIGETAACRAGVLRFADAGLSIRLASAERWRHALDGLAADLRTPRVFSAWQVARRCLKGHEGSDGTARSCLPSGRAIGLWRAVRAHDREGAVTALHRLIGCGVGLTPAGDDLVVGFLAGLRATLRQSEGHLSLRVALSAAAQAGLRRTNPISGAYLRHAAEGSFAEPLAGLAGKIARGACTDEVRRAARSALGVGATSGSDGVRGLLLGLAASPGAGSARGAVDG